MSSAASGSPCSLVRASRPSRTASRGLGSEPVAEPFSLGHFPMHLVMFDIDGTLTETMKVDEE
jgi:hypothetical protein